MPDRARELVASLDADALTRTSASGEWSALEVLRHLRDAGQVYEMRFKCIIIEDSPLLANYEEDRWVAAGTEGPEDVELLLTEMAAWRAELTRLLANLSSDGWSRQGRHEVIGTVTLEPYVRHQLAHEEQHLEQLRDVLSLPRS